MESKYNKVAQEIISLYCKNKQNKKTNCVNHECNTGKCLCMDEEQICLLNSIADYQYQLKVFRGNRYLLVSKTKLNSVIFCENMQKPYDRRLIACGKMESKRLAKLIRENSAQITPTVKEQLLRALPLIQTINAENCIEQRGTISYFCIYGKEKDLYLKGLLSAMIVKVTELLLNNEESEQFLGVIENIFAKMEQIYTSDRNSRFRETLLSNISDFEESFAIEENSLYIVKSVMEKYYSEVVGCELDSDEDMCAYILPKGVFSRNDCVCTYSVFKQLLKIGSMEEPPILKRFFEKIECEVQLQGVYKEVIDILQKYDSYNEEQKRRILEVIRKMYSDALELCDENIDELQKI